MTATAGMLLLKHVRIITQDNTDDEVEGEQICQLTPSNPKVSSERGPTIKHICSDPGM